MERGNRRFQYLIVSSVTSAAVALGVSFSWATPVLPKISRNEIGFPISNEAISWMVAISSIGYVTGAIAARNTSDGCGRRITILGSSLPMTLGTIFMIFAREAWMLSFGRFLWGCGKGMVVAVSSLYIAEIADKEVRGRLSLSNRFMMSFGCLLVISVGAFVSYQTLNYMMLALPVLFFSACWWIPESPYYLLKEGKVEAAKKTVRILTGIRDEDVLEEKVLQMQSHVRIEMSRSSTVKEFLTSKRYRKSIFIVVGIKVPQIMSGLHAIQSYLGPILLESKSGMNITTALVLFGTARFLLGIMSSVLVDRLGRRPLLIFSFMGTSIVLGIVALYFGLQDTHGSKYPYNLIPFVGIIIAIVISVLGYESVAYLVPAELFPMNVKSIAMAMVMMFSGFTNFTSMKSYQQIKDFTGLCGLFSLYASSAFCGSVLCYFLVPETKGKSLKEIQIELHGNIYDEEEKLNKVVVKNVEEDKTENKIHE